jgi:hypothetical protein
MLLVTKRTAYWAPITHGMRCTLATSANILRLSEKKNQDRPSIHPGQSLPLMFECTIATRRTAVTIEGRILSISETIVIVEDTILLHC